MGEKNDVVLRTFRALVEGADRKFARVRDVPAYGHVTSQQYFHKVFKAYTKLWKYQQDHRSELIDSSLHCWEISEIASRIGQLYFGQYMQTSKARFLVEAYVSYFLGFDFIGNPNCINLVIIKVKVTAFF